jgi:hypothetical protein
MGRITSIFTAMGCLESSLTMELLQQHDISFVEINLSEYPGKDKVVLNTAMLDDKLT